MKGYLRLVIITLVILAALSAISEVILHNSGQGEQGRPYRVEAQRIAHLIENGEEYDLTQYRYITHVEALSGDFQESDSDYLVKEIGGTFYRFDYETPSDNSRIMLLFHVCYLVMAGCVIVILLVIFHRIIRPFEKIRDYPQELAKGSLTIPLKAQKNEYFGRFIWGLDLLREKSEERKAAELALQKQNKTMVLSLSHDIKTPLSVIDLYAKALEKGLYREEEKKKEIAVSIHSKCEDIRQYVDAIARTAGDEFFDPEVRNGEFYLSELTDRIRQFYTDKLQLLKTDFQIEHVTDCLLSGDLERMVEILQNIIENAIKYGDGKNITLSFSREEDCQLIHISNTGCHLSETELPHIFDSFWRGSNVGTQSGSGLGLYICRTLLHKMNGSIYAGTSDNRMIVTVVIPLR